MTEDVEMGEAVPDAKVAAPETTIEQESLKAFYRRVYPFEQMHAWLSYGDGKEQTGVRQSSLSSPSPPNAGAGGFLALG